MATHFSILAWKILRIEDRVWWAAIHGVCKESDMAEAVEHTCIHNGQSLPVSKLTKTFSVCAVICQMAIIMIMPSF